MLYTWILQKKDTYTYQNGIYGVVVVCKGTTYVFTLLLLKSQ